MRGISKNPLTSAAAQLSREQTPERFQRCLSRFVSFPPQTRISAKWLKMHLVLISSSGLKHLGGLESDFLNQTVASGSNGVLAVWLKEKIAHFRWNRACGYRKQSGGLRFSWETKPANQKVLKQHKYKKGCSYHRNCAAPLLMSQKF